MRARIYQPSRTAMQSGRAKTRYWLLDYEPETPRTKEPLMGWTSSSDMRGQISLRFASQEDAIAYAEANAIPYDVILPEKKTKSIKAYADNFKYGRLIPWSH